MKSFATCLASKWSAILLHAEIIFNWPPARSRCLACACSMSRCVSMGAMNVSASSTEMGVALKAPAMVRRQLFCMTESLLVDIFDFLTSLGMCHTVDTYVMAGRTTAL